MNYSINMDRKKISFIFCFISAFLAHSFLMYNSFYENNADCYVLSESSIHPQSGRYIGWIIQKTLANLGFTTVIRPINVLVSIFLICIICVMLVEIFDMQNMKHIVIFSLLFPLQPCIIQILGYIFVCHIDFFSELLMVLAMYYILKKKNIIIPIIFIIISLGIYQAYLPLGVMIIFIYCFMLLIDNKNIKEIVRIIIKTIIIISISIVIYILGSNAFLKYTNLQMYSSQGLGKNVISDISFLGYINRIKMTYIHMIELFTNDYGNIFNFRLLIPVIIIMMIVFLIKLFSNKRTYFINKMILIGLLIISPIIFDFSYVMAGITNNRVQTSLFFLILMPLIIDDKIYISETYLIDTKTKYYDKFINIVKIIYNNIIKYGVVVFVCMFIFISNGEHYNLYIHSKDFARNINYIVNKIYTHPDYKDGMRILVVGNYSGMKNEVSARDKYFFNIHDKPVLSTITWEYSMPNYFRMYGSMDVVWIVIGEEKEKFRDMPSYPEYGCIKKIGDNDLVIKFSD